MTDATGPAAETPRRAKGHALPRSGLDIERMSEVTDLDIAHARTSWESRAPEAYKGLIEATPGDVADDGPDDETDDTL